MRRVATGLLVAMASLFLLARHMAPAHPGWGWALSFAEAAMVGGLADWFAVTALFRHPLGLPIPHTAIIPENKDRIADSMAAFLRANFLTPQVVARRLGAMNLAAMAGDFLAAPRGGPSRLREGGADLLADVLEALDPEQLGAMVKGGLRTQLEKLDLAPLLGQMLAAAIADRRHLAVLESLLHWAGLTLEANEGMIRALIHDRANAVLRWTGLDERLANAILDGLYKLLAECMVDPNHPLRRKAEEGLETLARDLAHDPATQARVAALKGELLANPAIAAWLDAMWERLRAASLRALRDPSGALSGPIGEAIGRASGELGQALRDDPHLQRLVNRFARRTLVGTAHRYGDQIVRLVSETVKGWDSSTVTTRIEGAVGRDLQFIRINGTLVGGSVGLLLHAADVLL
ncbi:DUF445 domain-containing protein [Novosphingobium flavum]|uniref:DUF445 domain-containing protein n=1 Tax=Novosphingobium flavum TaxID=1778672 RepID=A0A7X1FPC2_9SPHN|nr:DUF445 domain-containing protein [Novosphingobium flavum]MBC2664486.1 DUF445 domain-containing protein [Novosphingobium flavum]